MLEGYIVDCLTIESTAMRRSEDDLFGSEEARMDSWSLPRQQSLPEIVETRIIDLIHRGDLKPGDRLIELDLSKKLGVSRAVLREALRMLEIKYVVVSRKGRGTFVTALATDQFIKVSVLRATLEGTAARLVVERLTPEMMFDLNERVRKMERAAAGGRVMEWRQLDWQFHESICVMADNTYLLAAWRSISNLIKLYIMNHPDHDKEKSLVRSNHQALLDALASGDPERAEHTFKRNMLRRVFVVYGRPVPKAFSSILDDSDSEDDFEMQKKLDSRPRKKK